MDDREMLGRIGRVGRRTDKVKMVDEGDQNMREDLRDAGLSRIEKVRLVGHKDGDDSSRFGGRRGYEKMKTTSYRCS